MRNFISRLCTGLVGLAVFCVLASPAFASSLTAQLQDPPSNNIVDNLYVGAYNFTNMNNSSTFQMICDDFRDETNFNATTYTVRSFDPNQLQGTLWGASPNAGILYQQAGWLAMGMMNQTGLTQGEYHFALWAIFDASDVLSYLKGFSNGKGICNDIFGANNNCSSTTVSGGLLLQAQQNYGNFNYSNMMIVTPPCMGTQCAQQEFLMFSAPDGGSLPEYLGLTAAACLSTVLYSRKRSGLLKVS